MVGKVHKKAIYSDIRPDLKALKLLAGLKDRSDTTILKALTKEFEKNDF